MKKVLIAMVAMVVVSVLATGCLSSRAVSQWNGEGKAQATAMAVDANGVRTTQINWLDKGWLDYCTAHPVLAGVYAIGDIVVTGGAVYGVAEAANAISGNGGDKTETSTTITAGGDVVIGDNNTVNKNESQETTTSP